MEREILAKRSNKTIYREGDRVFKVFDHTFPKANVLNEALNQARVEETGLPIPRVLGVSVTENGEWSIEQDYIKGKTLARLIEEEPERKEEYLEQFVDLQLFVHSKTAPVLNKLKDKLDTKISGCKELDPTVRYELRTRLESMPKHKKVLHGDFNPTNVIVGEEWKLLYIRLVPRNAGQCFRGIRPSRICC